jgi:hypothetical protein
MVTSALTGNPVACRHSFDKARGDHGAAFLPADQELGENLIEI